METISYELRGVVPRSELAGVEVLRLEIAKNEPSPLALVWYRTSDNPEETGARIDLQKQVFLDDFGACDRASLNAEAKLIVNFVHSRRFTALSVAR